MQYIISSRQQQASLLHFGLSSFSQKKNWDQKYGFHRGVSDSSPRVCSCWFFGAQMLKLLDLWRIQV